MRLYFRFYVNGWFSRLALPHFSKVTLELPSSGGGGAERGGGVEPKNCPSGNGYFLVQHIKTTKNLYSIKIQRGNTCPCK